MSVTHSVQFVAASIRRSWYVALFALALGLCFFGLLFQQEITNAVTVWTQSTAFNHCFLVLPVAAYLAWTRRDVLAYLAPRPTIFAALAALPVAICWLLAERIGIMEGRQLLAMTIVQLLFLSVLGSRLWCAFSAALLYLFFLVPFGGFLVPILQHFTAWFITVGLDLFGIVNYSSGSVIEIPEGKFFVAEACAGLRFLIASVAFGALYACVIFNSPVRRTIFMAIALIVPVIANGIRALGTVVTAHLLGTANAVAADHVFYGWLFFSIVTLILILVGLPFRETSVPGMRDRNAPATGQLIPVAVCAAAVVLLATIPRAAANWLENVNTYRPPVSEVEFPTPSGCSPAAASAVNTIQIAAQPGQVASRTYYCGNEVFVVNARSFPARIAARPVFESLHPLRTTDEQAMTTDSLEVSAGGMTQRWSQTSIAEADQYTVIASAIWIDGRPSAGLSARIRQALNSFRGVPVSPITVVVTYRTSEGPQHATRAINSFLKQMTMGLSEAIGRSSSQAART